MIVQTNSRQCWGHGYSHCVSAKGARLVCEAVSNLLITTQQRCPEDGTGGIRHWVLLFSQNIHQYAQMLAAVLPICLGTSLLSHPRLLPPLLPPTA